jgi:hypothetical protein
MDLKLKSEKFRVKKIATKTRLVRISSSNRPYESRKSVASDRQAELRILCPNADFMRMQYWQIGHLANILSPLHDVKQSTISF